MVMKRLIFTFALCLLTSCAASPKLESRNSEPDLNPAHAVQPAIIEAHSSANPQVVPVATPDHRLLCNLIFPPLDDTNVFYVIQRCTNLLNPEWEDIPCEIVSPSYFAATPFNFEINPEELSGIGFFRGVRVSENRQPQTNRSLIQFP